ncbi:LOW QUALITY PROTEIN: polycystin-1 [Lampris incognitus]|uniref:LOW QUALITY PROTEIN: polycystin-1 n=1 Tax=Lampris incognitus TaxID=2546036 RepID=UPI0024B4E6A5|nr:LOW QUALITY PROTEIN: polycystin-1 [Lampris incognitus]
MDRLYPSENMASAAPTLPLALHRRPSSRCFALRRGGFVAHGDAARSCSPCPLNCTCVLSGPTLTCVVNCSNGGLERAPAAADVPLATNVLDLSRNHIPSLDTSLLDRLTGLRELYLQGNRINVLPRGVFCCGPLSILDLSNNQITTIEERICDNLCNLTQIDLSSNPYECDCKLFRLVSWLQEKGVRVRRPDAMLCHHPPDLRHQPLLNISLLTCGLNYAACLEDSSSGGGGRSELVIFSSSTPGNFSRQQCNSVCFAASHRYGGLGARRECLCSTNSEPNFISESQCSAACTNPHVMKECGWTLAHDVFAVDFSVMLKPLPLQSVHQPVLISASSSVTPVRLSWDFGDLSPRVNTTEVTAATHKYGYPGRFTISVIAWAGHKEVKVRREVTVVLPPKLKLLYPPRAVANQSLEFRLISWGSVGVAVDWKITKDGVQTAKASPYCPRDGVYHAESSRCFQIVPGEFGWTEARRQCADRGGDLAIVRTDTLRNLLAHNVTQERGVWLGLSDVDSPDTLRWVNGSEAREGEGGLATRSQLFSGNVCVSLDQNAQTSSHPCSAKRAYVCQYSAQVRVPDTGVYMLGLAVFPSQNPLYQPSSAQLSMPPQPPSSSTEVLMFPAINIVQAGWLSSLEFVTLGLSSDTHVRFQTYTPHCHHPGLHLLLPSCGGPVCSPVAVCVPTDHSGSSPPTICPPIEQWCPFQRRCIALSSPCYASLCHNCTQAHSLPPGVMRPRYTLQDEVLFTLPAGPAAHVLVREKLEALHVSPGDVIALQHDAGSAALLRCHTSPQSPWRQPVLALNQSEWFWARNASRRAAGSSADHDSDMVPEPVLDVEAMVKDGEGGWLEDVVCPVRVLYAGHSETLLQGPKLSAGLSQPGVYKMLVTSAEPSYPASASCEVRIVPPLGLTVLHPLPQNGTIYLQPNDTRLLLRVQSRYVTKVSRSGTNLSAIFHQACPPEFSSSLGLCQSGPSSASGAEALEPNLFAVLDLGLEEQHKGMVQVELEAHSEVMEGSLSVVVCLEEPLRGLVVQPHPANRVLMESVVSYTASVLEGSNPTFKWTVDDKPYFTYYNTVLNVIYQNAAVYKLTVTAMNHVSSLTEHFNVTVDRMQPMANLTVRGVPDVVTQGSAQTLTASVVLDMSVAATFRWSFGDGGYKEFEYKPPYASSSLYSNSPNQLLLSNNVTYVYPQPGVYTVLMSVSNRYENISTRLKMHVYSILNRIDIETVPRLLLAGTPASFEAHAWPSPYSIHYTWNFGDGTTTLQGRERQVMHTYAQSGVFNVCVSVNNTISSTEACVEMLVYDKLEKLTAGSSSPTELHMPTKVWADLASGNNVTWIFSMGDGTNYTKTEPNVSHTYIKDGNYTVNVTASNAVSSVWTILPVRVFVFQVLKLEPSGCVQERIPIHFQAWVSGNASAHLYEWSFGDGSPNETYHGNPKVTHTYWTSGNYHLSLLLSSGVNKATKANFFNWVCVQPAVTNVSLTLGRTHFQVGEEIWFQARAEPEFNYSYLWDFDVYEDSALTRGSGDMPFTYKNPGQYVVKVTIYNNISASNTSVIIEVEKPVGQVLIQHNGTRYNNLTLHEPYRFSTSSLASHVNYIWNMGDGTVLKGQNIIHNYSNSGNYNITMTAANTVSRNHTILAVAVLALIQGLTVNASLVNVPLNASVHFEAQMEEGDGVRFSWILCDRCTSIPGTHTMFYTFRSVGTFNIIVTAENDVGTAQASIFLFVQRELEGLHILAEEVDSGGVEGCYFATNHVLHLQAALREGTNMSFTWNVIKELEPINSGFNISGKTIHVNFSTPGPCDILLRASNLLGQLFVNRTIQFLDPVGGVSLWISNNPVAVNAPTNLTVLTTEGSNLQYSWSVDGNSLLWNKPWVIYTFTSPGQRLVSVEVFNEVSSEVVSDFVRVEEVISGLTFSASNVTEQNYVATGVNILLQGEVQTGTNVTWTWLLPGRTETGRNTSLIFSKPSMVTISLNASNSVSGDVVSRDFFVQEKIQALELRASKQFAAVGEKVEFTISLVAGSDVSLILSISGDATVIPHPNQTYVHQFTRAETYMVNLTAHNQVSVKRRHLQVEVMVPVHGLTILDCCEAAIVVGVKRTFVANILTGKPVHFLWTFDLHHLDKTSCMGKEVSYTPEEAGSLTIYLRAFNALHGQNITKHILVQNLLTAAALDAVPQDTFVNKTVKFITSVTPRSNAVACLWDFGDGSTLLPTNSTTVGYEYSNPGHFLVQVNCSNLVSWVLARVEVNIQVLECDEPEVQVVQAPRLAIWRSQPTLVEASVDLKGCVRYGAQYLWQILSIPYCDNDRDGNRVVVSWPSQTSPVSVIPLPGDVDMRRLQLSVPKMALAAGNYTLVFSLSYEGVPLRKAACLQLSVMAARLVPIIEGGTYRVWSRTKDLQLSAEQSYDPNMDPDNQSLLHYNWECQSTSKGTAYCSSLNFGLGSSGPVLGISGSELEADVEYTFQLTISKDGMAPESNTQTVLVQSGDIPMVYLECVSCKAQSIYEVSQNSYVYLRGTCTNCQDFHRGRWTAMTLRNGTNETLVLDSSSTTTGSDGMNLVLRQGALRHGDSYIFTLHVTDGNLDGEGAASITLRPNMPPAGGECHLRGGGGEYGDADGEGWRVRTLLDRVHFSCSGYSDLGVSETPLLYSLLVTRCKEDYCEEFCVYKGTSPEHSAFLPPGFSSARHRVAVSITVEDHQGAAITAVNKSIEVVLPDPPPGYSGLPHWLAELTDRKLKELLKQGDSQRVRELSLALITVLNEYEKTRGSALRRHAERHHRVSVRSNITRALTALDLITVNDIQQTSAALAQCTAVSPEFICEECQNSTLNKLESMLEILQTDTKQGTVTPTEIADNILNIMGDLIHQVSQLASQTYIHGMYGDSSFSTGFSSNLSSEDQGSAPMDPSASFLEPHPLRVAAKAYSLSSMLMTILMHGRVLNEEPLVLRGAEIAATGKLADPQSLLCYHGNESPECQRFSIPRAFNNSLGKAAAGNSIMQLLLRVGPNPYPSNYIANYTISTEVASMEFRTENGTQIPIYGLDDSQAITVAINNGSASGSGGGESGPEGMAGGPTTQAVNISHCDSIIVRVSTGNSNRQAGLFVQLNFTSLEDGIEDPQRGNDVEEPHITAYLHYYSRPNEFNCTDRKHITLSMTRGHDLDHRKYTLFISPEFYDTTLDYFVNVTSACSSASLSKGLHLEVGVFVSLCQYFSESEKQWRTDGMVPLAATNASRAVCRTRHLTDFAASLFVPLNAIEFLMPERLGAPSLVVLLVCVLGLLCYAVAAAILHKLDQLDLRRAGVVPLCGRDGLFKYEVQVKTGWSQGAGTTAHVGISLYGRESRSGHRHLDSRGAFTRNALDIFRIATDTSLGNIWKIRIWHDNKGLSPAWLLQYVLVKDLQTGSSYYFLVEEWLSVDNERTDGRVEIGVESTEEAVLRQLSRLLVYELERALCESHLWVSLWERPTRSPFTRLQRATCCAVLLQLCLLANTLWYSTVVDKRYSPRAVSMLSSLSGETVAVGLVSCLVVYPLYLLVYTLFRMSRSKCVSVEHVPPQADQESVEIDDFLDNSVAGSSFLFFNRIHGETNSEETNIDLPTPSTKSVESWGMAEQEETDDRDWPELLSDVSVVGGMGMGAGLIRLKRGQGSRHLGVDMTFNPDDEEGTDQHNKYFTSSDEDLIKHILADGQNFFPQADESEMADLSSIFGDKTEVILLQKLNEPLSSVSVRRDPPKTAFTSNTVVTDVCRPRRFPPWCGRATLWCSWAGITLANGISVWAGHGFSQGVAVMWLISCFSSFLCSCLLLEPVKMLCEAVYYAVFVRRLRPEDQDVLVDFPRVERVVQRVPRVRPPQGFALSQARQQARKVHMLHTMLKNFLVYMFFLLVVLLLNYSDTAKDTHSLRLRTHLQRTLCTPEYRNISRREDILMWLNHSLLPCLLDDAALLKDTGSVLLGTLRLRQIRDAQDSLSFDMFDGSPLNSMAPSAAADNRGWRGDQFGLDKGSGSVYQLNRSLTQVSASIQHLQQLHWLNHRTRAVFVEFSLYNINTNLLAVFSFLFEFPVSDCTQSSLDLLTVHLCPITGLDLQLLLTIVLLALVLYFLVRGILGYWKEGYAYLLSAWWLLGLFNLALAASVCGLHLSCCSAAKHLWASYLQHPRDRFTDFYPVARLSQTYTVMSALLLFILVLKASHQLRFLREWAVFGRALRRSIWELLGISLALLLLLLAYSHTGHLLFHSVLDGYDSVNSACLSLLSAGGWRLLSWRTAWMSIEPHSSAFSLVFHVSFAILRLVSLWLVTSVLLRNYRRARAELYRPAVDLQDYEMVELFLRRLKMWMGLSRTKEFRHKVRFEGMELPPSRSSSTSDCKSLCLPPLDGPDSPDSADAGSEASWRPASSSPCSLTEAPGVGLGFGLGLGPGPGPGTGPCPGPGVVVGGASWRETAETEASLRRLLPTLDALLQQLDRLTLAAEDLYHIECRLEKAQRKRRDKFWGRGGGKVSSQRGVVSEEAQGVKETVDDKDYTRWRDRKGVKEKDKGSKRGKKKDKSGASKGCGNTVSNPRKTPVTIPVPFPKSKPASASIQTPDPHIATKHLISAPAPTPVSPLKCAPPPPFVPDSTAKTNSVHIMPSKITPAPSSTPASVNIPLPMPSLPSTPAPTPNARGHLLGTRDWDPSTERETSPPTSLFNHPAHTTTIPTRKRKRKPPPLKNKVHPNPDRHVSGHPKP